jgi:hypothetical protein
LSRIETSIDFFERIENKEMYKASVIGMLYNYNYEKKKCGAYLIAKHYDSAALPSLDLDEYLLLLYYTNTVSTTIRHSDRSIDVRPILKLRNGENTIRSYLKIHPWVARDELTSNILVLVRNNSPLITELIEIIRKLDGCTEFAEHLYNLIDHGPCGLILNSVNRLYKDQVLSTYLRNLRSCRSVEHTIKSIRLYCRYNGNHGIEEINPLIRKHLNNYTIDIHGDQGYYLRREALFYFLSTNPSSVLGHVIRFLSDKSRKLRNEVVLYLVSLERYRCYRENFSFCLSHKCNEEWSTVLDTDIFDTFFQRHSEYIQTLSPDESHFKGLIDMLGDPDESHLKGAIDVSRLFMEFLVGILNTYSTSDKYIRSYVTPWMNTIFLVKHTHLAQSVAEYCLKTEIPIFPILKYLSDIQASVQTDTNTPAFTIPHISIPPEYIDHLKKTERTLYFNTYHG